MSVENTDLERRVLAHERILQVLIADMAKSDPSILTHLQDVFSETHALGAHEQDYTDTAGYAEQFIHEVTRLGRRARGSA